MVLDCLEIITRGGPQDFIHARYACKHFFPTALPERHHATSNRMVPNLISIGTLGAQFAYATVGGQQFIDSRTTAVSRAVALSAADRLEDGCR